MFSMEVTRLIERCRQGDADALGELYKTYAQRMRGVCRRYVSDEETISDVLHVSFVIIFTSFDKLRDDRKAEAWMMSITRNVASKYKDHLAKMTFVQLEKAYKSGGHIKVTDIRPGLVDTAMAKGEGLFWVMPVEKVANQIIAAIRKKKSKAYITKRWHVLAIINKSLPFMFYKRM